MPWPMYAIDAFETVPESLEKTSNDEPLFYGPYNTLLAHLFPPTECYTICPERKPPPESSRLGFTTVFTVCKAFRLVFFLVIKPSGDYTRRSSRSAADTQMRRQLTEFFDSVDLPVVHGICALGRRLCFYSVNRETRRLAPRPILQDATLMKDVAPAERWNIDLLSEEGVARVTEVADAVKAMVNQQQCLVFDLYDMLAFYQKDRLAFDVA